MLELGLIGFPLGHSLSPILHKAALQSLGMEGEYRLYPFPPSPEGEAGIRELLEKLRAGHLNGLNVTIPHKQVVIPWLDKLTDIARGVGAVNTLIRQKSHLLGDNTDVPGFLSDLHAFAGDVGGQGRLALVLGAGGSARAVVYALIQDGWQVQVAVRRPGVSLDFPDKIVEAIPLSTDGLRGPAQGCQLIVNTTPVGMFPDVDGSPWPEGLPFPQGARVYDLVYNPPVTALVRQARDAGMMAENGLGMLIHQAALSFERWTGRPPSVQAMQQAVLHRQEEKYR